MTVRQTSQLPLWLRGSTDGSGGRIASYGRLALATIFILVGLAVFEVYHLESGQLWSPIHYFGGSSNATTATPAADDIKTSHLHYLIPAKDQNDLFCAVVASVLANKYPIPVIVGWAGEGEFDAHAAHVAKLRVIQRYLNTLPHGGEDDDLVLMGDGHDVLAQLPVDVMIERYFQTVAASDRRLADSYGISVEELHAAGLRQTLLWGADKMCWPELYKEAQCNPPRSPLGHSILGPKTNNDRTYSHPRFLNSGTVMGPVGDLRKLMNQAMDDLREMYEPTYKDHNSDQLYVARIFGRQETARAELVLDDAMAEYAVPAPNATDASVNGTKASVDARDGDSAQGTEAAVNGTEAAVNGTEAANATAPALLNPDEFHITLDYESSFVQTGCYSRKWMKKLQFNNPDLTATMDEDKLGAGNNFRPYPIQMPAYVYQSMRRVFDSIADQLPADTTAREWVGSLQLGTNLASEQIFGFYHATCSKGTFISDYAKYWFIPYLRPLLRAAAEANKPGAPIVEKLIDGRRWTYMNAHSAPVMNSTEKLGGVFADTNTNLTYIPYSKICGEHLSVLDGKKTKTKSTN